MLAGVAYIMRSQVYSMLSEGGVGGLLFSTIYLCGPLTPAPFPLMMLKDMCSKQSIH